MKEMNAHIMLLSLLAFCCGCLTNNYERFYVQTGSTRTVNPSIASSDVILKTVTTEDDVLNLIEDGYESIGYSSFTGPYTSMSCAVDTAVKHGATLVLFDIRFKEERQYTSVMYLPSYSTTYSSGNVNVTSWSPKGFSTANGSYSGTSATMTMNAVPVNRSMQIFAHDAMFFRKVDTSKLYGVMWHVPKRLPGESTDTPIVVRVQAVFHGSKAEKDGIKRNVVVKAINGVEIKTRKDIEPFLNGAVVTKVEVTNEK